MSEARSVRVVPPPTRAHKAPATFLAGAVAGAVAKTTIAPLDRTKINFQGLGYCMTSGLGTAVSTGYSLFPRLPSFFPHMSPLINLVVLSASKPECDLSSRKYSFRHALRFVVKSYRNDGLTSLWRGNTATMARVVPFAAIQFTAHEQYKLLLRPAGSTSSVLPPFRRLVAGSLAGSTATLMTYPLDMARARMAVTDRNIYRAVQDVLISTYKSEGFFGLYRGVTPTILGIVPYAGLSFFTYETLKKLYNDRYGVDPASIPRLAFGAVAGLVGQNASYPLDIARRRMQTEGLVTKVSYKDIVVTLRYVWHSEGWRGLFKGVSMNWIKGPIAVSVSFNTYELTLRFLHYLGLFRADR